MKGVFSFIVALFLASAAAAQDYEPTTIWPYAYSDFCDGELVMLNGQRQTGRYNVYLPDSRLHFLEGDVIREMLPVQLFSVEVGEDIYVVADGRLMRVCARSEKGLVVEAEMVDFAALNSTGGAYGSSSASMATHSLSSIEGLGGVGTNHMELKNSRNDGEVLPLQKKLYLVISGKSVYATRRDVEENFPVDKKAFRKFCKENAVSWRKPESLLKVIDYLTK